MGKKKLGSKAWCKEHEIKMPFISEATSEKCRIKSEEIMDKLDKSDN